MWCCFYITNKFCDSVCVKCHVEILYFINKMLNLIIIYISYIIYTNCFKKYCLEINVLVSQLGYVRKGSLSMQDYYLFSQAYYLEFLMNVLLMFVSTLIAYAKNQAYAETILLKITGELSKQLDRSITSAQLSRPNQSLMSTMHNWEKWHIYSDLFIFNVTNYDIEHQNTYFTKYMFKRPILEKF